MRIVLHSVSRINEIIQKEFVVIAKIRKATKPIRGGTKFSRPIYIDPDITPTGI